MNRTAGSSLSTGASGKDLLDAGQALGWLHPLYGQIESVGKLWAGSQFPELLQRERPELDFDRKIKLYTRVDPARGAAHLEAGVLTITLRKAAESGAQRIPIRKV